MVSPSSFIQFGFLVIASILATVDTTTDNKLALDLKTLKTQTTGNSTLEPTIPNSFVGNTRSGPRPSWSSTGNRTTQRSQRRSKLSLKDSSTVSSIKVGRPADDASSRIAVINQSQLRGSNLASPQKPRSFGYGNSGGAGSGYGGSGYGSSGYGNMYSSAGSGNLMYLSNFDTALTTLAFLSFGVFLLNMIFSFLNLNTTNNTGAIPIGPAILPRGSPEFPVNVTQRQRRELPSVPILQALNAIEIGQQLPSAFVKSKNVKKTEKISTFGQNNCYYLSFCVIQVNPFYRSQLKEIISSIIRTKFTNYSMDQGPGRELQKIIWKFHQLDNILNSGDCSRILHECSDVQQMRSKS